MSLYSRNSLYPATVTLPVPNGYSNNMDNKVKKNRIIYLDVTPSRSQRKPTTANAVGPAVVPEIHQDIVYENVKPVITILRVMGILPITKISPGVNVFQLSSPPMLYSVFIYFSLICYVFYFSIHKVQILRSAEGKFEEAVIEYLFTVYLFPLCVVPLIWMETRKIAEVLNYWVDFEVSYKKLSGRVLPMKLYRKSLILSVLIPLLSMCSVVITHVTMVHLKVMQLVPYVYLEIMTYILGGYWYLICETLSVCANVLAEDFQKALRFIGPASKIAEYRALWLQLSRIARDTGIANCYTFTFINLYLFLIITLSIYGLLSQISDGFGTKDIGLAITACCSVGLLFFICDEAHYASQNVRSKFQKKLLMVELSWMNTDAHTEVNMFLRATEMNPSQINLGGFFDVNRNLFKSLLATMVTYLVVLLQFQISIPDDRREKTADEDNINGTSPYTTEAITTTAITTVLTTLAKKKKKI